MKITSIVVSIIIIFFDLNFSFFNNYEICGIFYSPIAPGINLFVIYWLKLEMSENFDMSPQ